MKLIHAQMAIGDLKLIASYIKPAEFPGLARKIRSAIKSAEGARNNAKRFANRGAK
jgi:hypothetical protein